MGKGGTKFVGDAVSVRRKAPANDTVKNIKRNLDKFLETGVHPEIERMRQEHANQIPALPDFDVHRPFVFLDIAVAGKPLGRLVIELFDDVVPVAATHFRNRCLPGSTAGLAGSTFHKLLPRYALYGGHSARAGEGMRLAPNTQLRAVEGGVVAVALGGEDFAIALDRALNLDRTHQVVGRIHKGRELLDTLGDLRTLPDDSPVQRVTVVRCGATNHLGNHEELDDGAAGGSGGPPKDMATRLQEASTEARSAVIEALNEGLVAKKRRHEQQAGGGADAAGPSTSTAGGSGEAGGGAAGSEAKTATEAKQQQQQQQQQQPKQQRQQQQQPSAKARLLDSMLGDLGTDDGSSGGESSEGE